MNSIVLLQLLEKVTHKENQLKYHHDETGRFPEKPYYEQKELDILAQKITSDAADILGNKILYPISTDKLTVIIEKYVDDLDLYANLQEEYGDKNIEGVTIFIPFKKPIIKISENLQNIQYKENRLRTTLLHELGHVVIHDPLWQREFRKLQLPLDTTEQRIQICKRKTLFSKNEPNYENYDWMEWQANYFASAFLMPRTEIYKIYKEFTNNKTSLVYIVDGSEEATMLIDFISQKFQVSKEAALIRLKIMKILINQQDLATQPFLI